MSWWRASFEVPAELADAAAWLLAEALDTPVEVQDATTMDKSDAADVHRVVVSFEAAPPEDLQARVDACLADLGLAATAVQTQRHDQDTWKEGWKAFFRGQRLSPRIAVRPPWEADDAEAPITVIIEPGMAFAVTAIARAPDGARGVLRPIGKAGPSSDPDRRVTERVFEEVIALRTELARFRKTAAAGADEAAIERFREMLERVEVVQARLEARPERAADLETGSDRGLRAIAISALVIALGSLGFGILSMWFG